MKIEAPLQTQEMTMSRNFTVKLDDSIHENPVSHAKKTITTNLRVNVDGVNKLKKFTTKNTLKTSSATSAASTNMETVFSTFLGCSSSGKTNTNQTGDKKKQSKSEESKREFLEYLSNEGIFNDVGYDMLLGKCDKLRSLEQMIQSSQLEALKKTIFRQNYLIACQKFTTPLREELSCKYVGAVRKLLN